MLRIFFKDTVIYGTANIFSRGIFLILLPLYTRVFSPAEYGIIDIIAIFSSIINLTVALEISQGVALLYPRAKAKSDRIAYASTALWFTVAAYGIFILLALFLSPILSLWILGSTDLQNIFRVAILSMFGKGLFYLIQNQLRWQLQSRDYAISSLIFTLTSVLTSFILILFLNFDVKGVFYGNLCGCIFGSISGIYHARFSYKFVFDWHKCKEMLKYSLPLVPSSISIFVYLYIDRLALNHLMTLNEVGLYGVGYRFASIIGIAITGFQAALTPLVYHHYQKKSTPNEIAKIFNYFLLLNLSIIVFLSLFSHNILIIFTTSKYYAAFTIIPVIATAMLLSNMYIFTPGLGIAKKTKNIAIINIFSAILNIILNLLLIPLMGILGAALATLITSLISFTIYLRFNQIYYYINFQWTRIKMSILIVLSVYILINYFMLYYYSNNIILIKTTLLIFSIALIAVIILDKQEIYSLYKILAKYINI